MKKDRCSQEHERSVWKVKYVRAANLVVYQPQMSHIDHRTTSDARRTKAAWAHSNTRAQEPQNTEEATQHMVHILDAKYEKADLQAVVRDNCSHLNPIQQGKLLELLTEFEPLFDGTLGDWRTEPVSFQLKKGVKPYHGRAFPVPRIHKETLMKEVQRQCELGVLE